MTADVPSIAAVREAGLRLLGNFCEVGVKAEVTLECFSLSLWSN
jgi:hypothetical protein